MAGLTNTVLKAKVLPEDEEDDEGHEHERDDDPDQDAKNWSELQGNRALWKWENLEIGQEFSKNMTRLTSVSFCV